MENSGSTSTKPVLDWEGDVKSVFCGPNRTKRLGRYPVGIKTGHPGAQYWLTVELKGCASHNPAKCLVSAWSISLRSGGEASGTTRLRRGRKWESECPMELVVGLKILRISKEQAVWRSLKSKTSRDQG